MIKTPILFSIISFMSFSEFSWARIGESLDEIKTRVGSVELKADRDYPNELIMARCRKIGGFDVVVFYFFRQEGRSGSSVGLADIAGKCIGVHYLKFYDDWDSVEMTPKDAGVLLSKNYTDSSTNMQIIKSEGISGDVATSRLWEVSWLGAKGEEATASVSASERDFTPIFSVFCWSSNLAKFFEKKAIEEKKAKEQARQRKMDVL